MRIKTLFSELNGFAIFDSKNVLSFKEQHSISDDFLTPLIQTDLGEEISAKGITIPIIGVEPDDYGFTVSLNRISYLDKIEIESKGWILNSTGNLNICGVGYFKDFNLHKLRQKKQILEFEVPQGWLEIEIYAGLDGDFSPVFEIVVRESEEQPEFKGDLSTNYSF